jgi:hypothetical protein
LKKKKKNKRQKTNNFPSPPETTPIVSTSTSSSLTDSECHTKNSIVGAVSHFLITDLAQMVFDYVDTKSYRLEQPNSTITKLQGKLVLQELYTLTKSDESSTKVLSLHLDMFSKRQKFGQKEALLLNKMSNLESVCFESATFLPEFFKFWNPPQRVVLESVSFHKFTEPITLRNVLSFTFSSTSSIIQLPRFSCPNLQEYLMKPSYSFCSFVSAVPVLTQPLYYYRKIPLLYRQGFSHLKNEAYFLSLPYTPSTIRYVLTELPNNRFIPDIHFNSQIFVKPLSCTNLAIICDQNSSSFSFFSALNFFSTTVEQQSRASGELSILLSSILLNPPSLRLALPIYLMGTDSSRAKINFQFTINLFNKLKLTILFYDPNPQTVEQFKEWTKDVDVGSLLCIFLVKSSHEIF